jgi:hypothetical protein
MRTVDRLRIRTSRGRSALPGRWPRRTERIYRQQYAHCGEKCSEAEAFGSSSASRGEEAPPPRPIGKARPRTGGEQQPGEIQWVAPRTSVRRGLRARIYRGTSASALGWTLVSMARLGVPTNGRTRSSEQGSQSPHSTWRLRFIRVMMRTMDRARRGAKRRADMRCSSVSRRDSWWERHHNVQIARKPRGCWAHISIMCVPETTRIFDGARTWNRR